MKTTTILATLLAAIQFAAAGAAHAQTQPLTRAQVHAEVLAARAAGTLDSGGEGYQSRWDDTPSTLTRAEVRAQLLAARAAGQVFEGDAYPGNVEAPVTKPLTREQVRSELAAARAAGLVTAGEAYPGPFAAGG